MSRFFSTKNKRKPSRTRLAIDTLEERTTPVVGAYGDAYLAETGMGFDGVVEIASPDGGRGSGSLLYSGRHILTAAHVVDFDVDSNGDGEPDGGNGMVDAGTYTITFETRTGKVEFEVPSSDIAIRPGYTGNAGQGKDVAVIKLPELAPLAADRYELYPFPDEVGHEFFVVGYGLTGNGATGEIEERNGVSTAGTRRYGNNHFDALGDRVGGPAGTLAFDFDDGYSNHNALKVKYGIQGPWYGADEASDARGDSGGPLLLIDDNGKEWLAGVVSFGQGFSKNPDVSPGTNASFGEISYASRVFDSKGWIEQVVASGAYDLVFDLRKQGENNNGLSDEVEVKLTSSLVQLFLNGKLIHEDGISKIKSITIHGSADQDTINVPGSLGIPISIEGHGGGDSIVIDDSASSLPTNISMTDTQVVLKNDFKTTPVTLASDGLFSLTVKAGTPPADNLFEIPTRGNTITVDQTPSASAGVAILTGGGSDNVFIKRTSSMLSIGGQHGNDSVAIGNGVNLSEINGVVGVSNEFGSTKLYLFATLDQTGRYVVMDTSFFGPAIYGLSPAPILYGSSNIELNMHLGDFADTVEAKYVPVMTNIYAGSGDDAVNVTSASAAINVDLSTGDNYATIGGTASLSGISGSVRATGGSVNLTLDDRAQQYQQRYTLTGNSFQVGTNSPIELANLKAVHIHGGQGVPDGVFAPTGNTFEVRDTPAGAYTTLHTGAGRDTVIVNATTGKMGVEFGLGDLESLVVGTPARGLDGVKESIYLFDGGPGLSVTVDDSGAAAARTMVVDNDGVHPVGAGELDFGQADGFSLHISGGQFGNTFDIGGKRGNLSLNAGVGNDIVNIGGGDGLLTDLNHFIIRGQAGADAVNLFDDSETVSRTHRFFTEQNIPVFTTQGTTVIFMDNQTELISLHAGSGSDTINAQQFVSHASLIVDAGTGSDTVTGSSRRDLLIGGANADQIDGGQGEDVVISGGSTLSNDPEALSAVMDEWVRTDVAYADRVEHLLSGGGLNGNARLNLAAYVGDETQNNLTGGAELDLFYGSKARDAHDWKPAEGEVFVDDDASHDGIRINAVALPGSYVSVDYVYHNGDEPIDVELTPGSHVLYTLGGDPIYFTVLADGTVDYDPDLEGVLTGRGTMDLTVNGLPVQIDASAWPGSYVSLDYVYYNGDTAISASLLPGSHVLYTLGGDPVYFAVNTDGTIDYNAALDGVLSGRGTATLTVNGVEITMDASALPGSYVSLDYVYYNGDAAISAALAPGSHVLYTLGGDPVYFTVNSDGTIDYAEELDGVLTGRGTTNLTVVGRQVQIDASALPGSYVSLDYVYYDGDASIEASLLPGSHVLYTLGGDPVYFTVEDDGTVDYDTALDAVLTGRGTTSLTVVGIQVQIDASALPGTYTSLDYVYFNGDESMSVALLPGLHVLYTLGGDPIHFTVKSDGTIDYDSSFDKTLAGRGSGALTITGLRVRIDATALALSYLGLDYVSMDASVANDVVLLPGKHHVAYGGKVVYFTVNLDGSIRYDPEPGLVITAA